MNVILSYNGTILMPSFVWVCGVGLFAITWLSGLPPLRHVRELAKWFVSCLWLVHFLMVWYVVFKLVDFRYVMSTHLPDGRANYDFSTYISYATGLSLLASFGLVLLSIHRVRAAVN